MFQILFILLITVPLIEILLLLKIGAHIGIVPTIGLVILTGIAGVTLIRQQGLVIIFQMRELIRQGIFPENQLFDGILIFLAGALLLTPGFITDCIGFTLLLPDIRSQYRYWIKKWLKSKLGK
ncbi:FxsA family protein [Chlamydiota bacterium]